MTVYLDRWGDPARQNTKEEFLTAMCGLASDVAACVRLEGKYDPKEGCHYGCVCKDNDMLPEDKERWQTIHSAIIDFIFDAVHTAITEHQKTWEDDDE